MINTLISIADHEKVDVYRFIEVINDRGGSVHTPELVKSNTIVSIQTTGSNHSVGGQQIINAISGKTDKEVFIVFSPQMRFNVGDLLFRPLNDKIYEIQRIEHNGSGTLLQHDKYYMVEYNNQKVIKR